MQLQRPEGHGVRGADVGSEEIRQDRTWLSNVLTERFEKQFAALTEYIATRDPRRILEHKFNPIDGLVIVTPTRGSVPDDNRLPIIAKNIERMALDVKSFFPIHM